jgi:glycosyltransferase involved in cell wall biosynthesis
MAHLLRTAPARGIPGAAELLLRMSLALRREQRTTDVLHLNWLQCVLAAGGMQAPMLVTVLGADLHLLERPWIRALVRRALRGRRAVICPNAEWMVPVLRSALGDAAPDIRYIPFGLDRFWYEVERHPASGAQEWITVLRVTKRKIGKLFEWTRDIDPAQHRFNLFGPMQEDIEIPSWINYHGPVTPDELAASWYPRAAGMISLSEHDEGRPQVLLEAMAAGVPVICSRIPAHTDLLESLSMGKLAGDREDFLAALTSLQSAAEAGIQAERGRVAVLSAFGTWADCAQRYAAVYHDLMAGGYATCAS